MNRMGIRFGVVVGPPVSVHCIVNPWISVCFCTVILFTPCWGAAGYNAFAQKTPGIIKLVIYEHPDMSFVTGSCFSPSSRQKPVSCRFTTETREVPIFVGMTNKKTTGVKHEKIYNLFDDVMFVRCVCNG